MRTEEEIKADIETWKDNLVMVKKFRRELNDLSIKPKKVKKEVVEEEAKIYTADELIGLNKSSQIDLLEMYGVEGHGVPKLEKARVKLILKLQKKNK